jgi:hypothetical protein
MQSKKERLAAAEAELQAAQGREQWFWSEVVPEMRKAADVERQRRAEAEAQVGAHAGIGLLLRSAGTWHAWGLNWVPAEIVQTWSVAVCVFGSEVSLGPASSCALPPAAMTRARRHGSL